MPETGSAPLLAKIARLIEMSGPITLADYMHLCLADPEHGYYKKREAIGGGGDFITAPEVSQMFAELIGIWCISAWQAMDRPEKFSLVELGPGRGTLMRDLLRAARQMPSFLKGADILLIESSPKMIEAQRAALAEYSGEAQSLKWASEIADIPSQPAIIIANEFLDAIPFRQYAKTATTWQEVGVNLSEEGKLQRGVLAAKLDDNILPPGASDEPEGSIFEHAPAREAVVESLANHIADNGGAALFIDYGHLKSGFGDTFQAVRAHAHADPMEAPGTSDLTSHVDFERLMRTVASIAGIDTACTTQGELLLTLGLLERAGALGSGKDAETQNALRSQVERLASPDQMGQLFKAMAIYPDGIRLPGFENA